MSRQVRYRVTALVLGGLLLGAPLLTNGTASAGQVEGGGRQVVFGGGGVLGLSCRSRPDVESMTVPADSTVRMVNRTGHSAKLQLGGTAKGSIPENGSTEVVFRRGTTAVLLSPACALGNESIPLLVTATPSDPAAMPDPLPAPGGSSDSNVIPAGSGSPPASNGGSALPDAAAPPATTQRPATTSAGDRPGHPHTTTRPAAVAATEAMPQGGSTSRTRTRLLRGTVAAPPTFAGMPPGDHKAIVPGVPALSFSPDVAAAPAPPAVPTTEIAAAEPVATMQPISPSAPSGLLALVAIVCVLGVAYGTIRAFVAQRASRTSIA